MMTSEIDPKNILDRLASDSALRGEVAQLKAKSTLTEVLGQAPPFNWNYVAERVIRNAIAARHCMEEIALSEGISYDEFSLVARRFALAWESLSILREGGTGQEIALLNAATAYDFAGYQANAICLAKRIISEPSNAFNEVAGLVISRRFMNVAHGDWETKVIADVKVKSLEDVVFATAVTVATRALRELSWFFLSGSTERLERARDLFITAEAGLLECGAAEEATLVHTIRALLTVMQRRSTWSILGNVSSSPKWRRYLVLLARSLSSTLLNGTSIAELWPSQTLALDNGLLSDHAGKVIKMPTSAGKTRIAEMVLVHTLVENPGTKCIYIAPYRALVSEIESTLISVLGDLGFQVSTALGGFETDEIELFLSQNADVLVTTPEKLDLLVRLTPEYASQVQLVILDEGHILEDRRRGVKYDMLLTRFKIAAPQARFIYLSAVVSDTTLEELASWLNTGPGSTLRSEWRPSVQRLANLRWSGTTGTLHYAIEPETPVLGESFTPGIIRQQEIKFPNPATGRTLTRRFPDTANKSQIAAELALKFVDKGSVLIFCSQPNFTVAVGQAVYDRMNWSQLAGLKDVPIPVDTSNSRSAQLAEEWLGIEHKVTQLLRQGIAIHYGDLPDSVRNAIESDYRARRFPILVATNTLAQGVNLPIRTVIIHSVWRGPSDDRERIPARDYWNIAGRACRAGEETEGTIVHIVRTETDSWDYEYYQNHRENPEPLDSGLLRLLQRSVEGRLSDEAFRGAIDPEILAIAAEESSDGLMSARISDVLGKTLAALQMPRKGIPAELLRDKSISIANSITEEVPDFGRRRVFASTGLTTQSCLYLDEYVKANNSQIETMMNGSKNAVDSAETVSEIAAGVIESEVQEAFSGSYLDLLRDWMGGKPVPEIREALGEDAPGVEQLAKFIENYFSSRLPWVVSGFLRIAANGLGLNENELPLTVRSLPAMIKAGVEFPEAAWAASAGAASRAAAIRIGAAYVSHHTLIANDVDNNHTYSTFLDWIRPLTSEDLYYSYGLEGAVLEETFGAFQRNARNHLLNNAPEFPLQFEVRGISFHDRRQIAAMAIPGSEVVLERDYDNLMDRNAVFVVFNDRPMGYVPKDYAQLIAPDLDAGWRGNCNVVSNTLAAVPSVTVRVEH